MKTSSFNFRVDNDRQIIIYKHNGLLKLEDIGSAWQSLVTMEEFIFMGYNLLSDYSEAEFDFSVSTTQMVWDYFDTIKEILKNKKEAVIACTPTTTAISILFEHETLTKLNFEVKTFSTYSAAINWLQEK